MDKRFGYTLIIMATLATLVSMFPIMRFLSKIGEWDAASLLFWSESVPRVAVGMLILAIALAFHARGHRAGWIVLLVSPLLLWAADLALMVLL